MTQPNFKDLTPPSNGTPIGFDGKKLVVPDDPIIPFIEGDGTGPDIWRASQRVLDAAVAKSFSGKKKVVWFEVYAGDKSLQRTNEYLPNDTVEAVRYYRVAIKGPLTTPVGGGIRSLNVTLRQLLDLYACIRPVRWFEGVPSPVKRPQDVNMIIFRENTEDVYSGIEWKSGTEDCTKVIQFLEKEMGKKVRPDSGIGIKPISAFGSKRLVRKAIQHAIENFDRGTTSVTIVHKGNIQKYTEGAFRDWGYELAKEEFADQTVTEQDLWDKHDGKVPAGKVLIKDRIADSMFQQILLRPSEYSVLALTNLNGDYLSDALAAQVGGLGIAPGSNESDGYAFFEATHGTAPKYAGLDKINPGSVILSGVMMLERLGWKDAAQSIEKAIEKTIKDKVVTYDFARQMEGAREVKTSEFASAIIERL